MDEALVLCRFVQFSAAMLIFGVAAFRLYALPRADTRTSFNLTARFDERFGRVSLIASVAALISAIALLLCQAAAMAGSWGTVVDVAAVGAVLFDTRFGRIWCWHLLFATALVFACTARGSKRPVILILSLGLLASLAWVGHAAMGEGAARVGHELNQTAHLLAAGVWLGGLPPLGWLVRQTRRQPAEISLLCNALRNFSRMGFVAVALIALTGAVNTVLLVGSLGALLGTPYGRLLAFKILLFIAMAGLASINRLHLAPRIADEPGAQRALGRTVAVEQGLGLAVLAAVSVLGTWPPALYAY